MRKRDSNILKQQKKITKIFEVTRFEVSRSRRGENKGILSQRLPNPAVFMTKMCTGCLCSSYVVCEYRVCTVDFTKGSH